MSPARSRDDCLWLGGPKSDPRLALYTGQAPLAGWLRVVAFRDGLKLQKQDSRQVCDDDLVDLVVGQADARNTALRGTYAREFKAAFQKAVTQLSIHDRDLLRRHYLDELGIDSLSGFFDVHKSTVARWLARLRESLLQATRKHLAASLDLPDNELDEIVHELMSQLEVSLPRILG